MKAPLFAPATAGLSKPQLYLHRARMFRDAAIWLPGYAANETNWPAYALMLQACELAMKAFCDQSVANGHQKASASNHDLEGWYSLAIQYGLPTDAYIAEGIATVSEIHKSHYTRYPDNGGIQPRDLSVTNDVVDALISAASALIS